MRPTFRVPTFGVLVGAGDSTGFELRRHCDEAVVARIVLPATFDRELRTKRSAETPVNVGRRPFCF